MRIALRCVAMTAFWLLCSLSYCPEAFGQTVSTAPTPAPDGKEVKKIVEAPKPPEPRFKIYGWIEGGITGNPDSPIDNHNFGHLFTDRANEPMLNQAVITGERTLDPNATDFDWGLKIQFMYGSDSRYIHSVGMMDLTTDDRIQPDFPEVYANFHLPIITAGGLDLKIGKFVTLEGAETIDPRANVFYSHSYIFNFGIPFNNTGFQSVLHVNKYLDVYAGLNRGVNTSIQDNNGSVAFEGGIGLNLLDGNLSMLAITHAGPEDPHNNHDYRYLNDITTTWKITKAFTSITDVNLAYEESVNAWGGGVAQYFTYSLNDWLILGVRGEIWRDEKGFFVGEFRANNDFLHLERGDITAPDPSTYTGGDTTYLEVTLGVTIKPPVPKPLAGLLIRPEVRYDRALTDSTLPFDQLTSRDQWTLGLDVVLEF
ncbi:MAG TPA: porin [Chthoniobacterales bacterium]|nr:porin [Chthoniobacterales bacterium]